MDTHFLDGQIGGWMDGWMDGWMRRVPDPGLVLSVSRSLPLFNVHSNHPPPSPLPLSPRGDIRV